MFDNPLSRRSFLGGSAATVAMAALAPKITYAASGDTLTIRAPGDISNIDPGQNDFGMTFACDNVLYVSSVTKRSLYRLALDGTATPIGSSGALGATISALAAYGNPVQLYGLGNGSANGGAGSSALYKINTSTGVATERVVIPPVRGVGHGAGCGLLSPQHVAGRLASHSPSVCLRPCLLSVSPLPQAASPGHRAQHR